MLKNQSRLAYGSSFRLVTLILSPSTIMPASASPIYIILLLASLNQHEGLWLPAGSNGRNFVLSKVNHAVVAVTLARGHQQALAIVRVSPQHPSLHNVR
jgi:hypothetical protein